MRAYIKRMNNNPQLQKCVADIVANGGKFGIHNRSDSVAGWGVFTEKAIPRHSKVLVYQTTLHHNDCFSGDSTYCFQSELTPPNSFTTIPIVFDGAPSVKAIKERVPMTDMEARLAKVNGALNNHSCMPNIIPEWVRFGGDIPGDDGDWLICYKTHSKPILAGSELLSNYNGGSTKGHKYFSPIAALRKRGTPEHAIVRCCCKTSKTGQCPNNYAFDRDIMEGRIASRAPAGAQ
jgi:hypothetical protein